MLDGLPFFALGNWAAWRRWDIKAISIPWHWVIFLGAALSFAEAYFVGKQELYFGTMILLVGLMGRCIRYRRVPRGKFSTFLQLCGELLTLPIFVIHLLVIALFREVPVLAPVQQIEWLLPIIVAILSTAIALMWFVVKATLSEYRKK
jgi:peptidoglycan/LPS O-acetylase OafA/YrhL